MILVMSRIAGIGCSTIAYNMSRLYELPFYVYKDSIFNTNEMIRDAVDILDENKLEKDDKKLNDIRLIEDITTRDNIGVFDLGSKYTMKSMTKKVMGLAKKAKVALVPFQIGFENIDKTIQTLVDIKTWNPDIKIVLVLNKLDSDDDPINFVVKNDFIELFKERVEGVKVGNDQLLNFIGDTHYDIEEDNPDRISFNNSNNIVLTYLRYSNLLTAIPPRSYNLEFGEYFLDMFKYSNKNESNAADDYNEEGRYDSWGEYIPEVEKYDPGNLSYSEFSKCESFNEMEFKFFRYLFFLTIRDAKTKNEDKYIQHKDFVAFRNFSLDRLSLGDDLKTSLSFDDDDYKFISNNEYVFGDIRFEKLKKNHMSYNQYNKFIKDFAYIIYEVTSSQDDKDNGKESFYDFLRVTFPNNVANKKNNLDSIPNYSLDNTFDSETLKNMKKIMNK